MPERERETESICEWERGNRVKAWKCEKGDRGTECVWRLAWAKNVSVTAALCICLAWVTPVTQTFPSSLLAVLSHCCSSGGQSTHTQTHTAITTTHYHSVFPLSGAGNRLCVSLSRPGLSEPYDPNRTSHTVLLLCNHSLPAKTAHVHSMFPAHQFLR